MRRHKGCKLCTILGIRIENHAMDKRILGCRLQKIHTALHRKGGVKKSHKVHQQVGRAKEKYLSVRLSGHLERRKTGSKLSIIKAFTSKYG